MCAIDNNKNTIHTTAKKKEATAVDFNAKGVFMLRGSTAAMEVKHGGYLEHISRLSSYGNTVA